MHKKAKILAIDDEEITLMVLSELLRKMDYHVFATPDPVNGIDLALKEKPDLILLDVYMPLRNGWSVLSQLRSDETIRKTPVIILTTDDQVKSVELAYELGVSSYLTKPVNADLLKSKVHELLNNKI